MWNNIFIILFEIGFGLKFEIIGVISLSELFLIFTSVFFIKQRLFRNYPELKKISLLYLGLLCAQIVSEIIVGNDLNNTFKGIAVTVVSYLHFMFLFRFIIKRRNIIVFVLIGMIIQGFAFRAEVSGGSGFFEGVIAGEGGAYLKFYFAPMIINILLVLSVFIRKKRISIIFIFAGSVLVILGARSSGLMTILTGMIAYMGITIKSINWKRLMMPAIFVVLIGYGAYAVYVNKVLEGEITSGNSQQLTRMNNPYNPFGLLIMGRTEVFVCMEAFMDKFWTGHGAWAKDITGKYNLMIFQFRNSKIANMEKDIIPAHSVLVGAGMQNGVFAFMFMFMILYFFLKRGFMAISKNDPYVVIIVSFMVSILWHGLFSPTSGFRLLFPTYFVMLLTSYLVNKKDKNNENLFCNHR
jgi:hypothetical protein